MGLRDDILNAIQWHAKAARDAEFPFRHHLGASLLGHSCERYLFYTFRWAQQPDHSSRLLRIFDRGKSEELRIIAKLKQIGLTVVDEGDFGAQIRATGLPNHIGGSLDAMLHTPANYAQEYGSIMPIEIKTHNHKSFTSTMRKDLNESYPQHYTQGNIYGWSHKATHFMYVAENKNDDTLDLQILPVNNAAASLAVARGERIVYTQNIAQLERTEEKWRCKMCDFKDMCKKRERAKARNCRSCGHFMPMQDGTWMCNKFMYPVPKGEEIVYADNCDEWVSVV